MAEADQSRNELEAVEKSKAEELRREAETHVREVEQREHEASQSRQSAPTVSSAPPPPPPPPTPTPHHPPATSGSTQHAPAASTTGPASLPPRPPAPALGLPDVNAPRPVAPVRHPPPALDSSYRRSAACPPEPHPVPMSREPPRAPRGMLIPPRGHWEPPRVQEWRRDSLAPLWDNQSQRDWDRATEQAGLSRGLSESLRHPAGRRSSLPHNDTPGHGLRQDDGTPDLHEDNPCRQELMGRNHCKVEGILLTLCLPHPTRGWSLV
ncbi:hypothetical protein BS47DRAFT_1403263 [Hydnum rufescens UP504]|uniref:Uncharacterized protein n=1 Tax=Hydnum rufescens UP504 TaxID=1448309 RepID=A0A9P6AB38_9AGAM|nr:hypothetical protein BS47DRAFT_1403263 [Hydnum rufescens UP504]